MTNAHVASKVDKACCTGCGACYAICPQKCISMMPDKEGFSSPCIVEDKCIQCGLCTACCPTMNKQVVPNAPLLTYAAIWLNNARTQSSSGGLFAMFAMRIIADWNGHVYGCAFNNEITAMHTCISDLKGISRLQGSKYVQSDMINAHAAIKKDLENNIKVLFCGTPCQVHALRCFLKNDYKNLICIDLICHGVPSPMLFKRYIKWLENQYGTINSYHFRTKDKYSREGFKANFCVSVADKKIIKETDAHSDPYFAAFARSETYRMSCYSCPYTSVKRYGDITIGDCSSIRNDNPNFYPDDAVSSLFIISDKGNELWRNCLDDCDFTELTLAHEAKLNQQLNHPSTLNKIKRTQIYQMLQKNDFDVFETLLLPRIRLRRKLRLFVDQVIPFSIRRRIKRMIRM